MGIEEEYKRVTEEIFSRHRSVQTAGFSAGAYKPGLERMRRLDAAIGAPAAGLRSIHVAGTNGKGSVSHMLAAALAASCPGSRIGLYTSPHLLDFRERIKIIRLAPEDTRPATPGQYPSKDPQSPAFTMIPRREVLSFLAQWQDLFDREEASFFEITTAMALWWFKQSEVDIAVIETGLGGRLDSTNIITPELSIITSIGMDHCAILGDSLQAIAAEKAGIFKPGVPALAWGRDPQTGPLFEHSAATVAAPLYYATDIIPDTGSSPLPDSVSSMLPQMDLRGGYQEVNLRTVLAAAKLLGLDGDSAPVREAICHSAALTGLRGRWEILGTAPLTIADIGHNPPALRYNFAQLREMMAPGGDVSASSFDKLIIVYGIMADKDLDSIIPLMPPEASYIFVTPDTPRALPSGEILLHFLDKMRPATPGQGALPDRAGDISAPEACDAGSVAEGVRRALAEATPRSLIYIGGSTFVVAEVLNPPHPPKSGGAAKDGK